MEGKEQIKDVWQEVVVLQCDGSPYSFSQFDAKLPELGSTGWCILAHLEWPEKIRKVELTMLNIQVREGFEAADIASFHELLAITVPGKKVRNDSVGHDLCNLIICTGLEAENGSDRDSGKSRYSSKGMLLANLSRTIRELGVGIARAQLVGCVDLPGQCVDAR